jgi:dipeptide/tripeptide permease
MVETLSAPGERGALTGIYYALTYVGFAAPYLLAAVASWTEWTVALGAAAILAALTAAWLLVRTTQPPAPAPSTG